MLLKFQTPASENRQQFPLARKPQATFPASTFMVPMVRRGPTFNTTKLSAAAIAAASTVQWGLFQEKLGLGLGKPTRVL